MGTKTTIKTTTKNSKLFKNLYRLNFIDYLIIWGQNN